jgi:hypothetical protein
MELDYVVGNGSPNADPTRPLQNTEERGGGLQNRANAMRIKLSAFSCFTKHWPKPSGPKK